MYHIVEAMAAVDLICKSHCWNSSSNKTFYEPEPVKHSKVGYTSSRLNLQVLLLVYLLQQYLF